ncbi:uncharacterized protein LOC141588810 [Silene latifolia]|uniref:uncharacterized protein LOC141588810 n=1 Tax=Silene latifolia TaxID=37657 RepID=UPI003D781F8F
MNLGWFFGDFNCVLSHSERLGGSSTDAEIDEFQSCLDACGLIDSPAQGAYYTWNNKQDASFRVFSRLDRVLINSEWSREDAFHVCSFPSEGTFDHTPGTKMFQVVRKLKNLKVHLRQFNKDHFADIENAAAVALRNLEDIQISLIDDPSNQQMLNMEAHLCGGVQKLQVLCVKDSKGQEHSAPQAIEDAFLTYYKELLGTAVSTDKVNFQIIKRGQVCDASLQDILVLPVTNQEIKTAIFSIPDHKAPGLDGYSSAFFKDSWTVIGDEVCAAVQDVFNSGKLLKQLNATTVTLIPKCKMPTYVHQFRPIACCNVLYKCISKILCNRISLVLPELISKNQGGFIKGRSILENIMVCQDLVRLYNRQSCSARCMFKMDLMKAYDSVSWDFLADILEAFNFPVSIRRLIMECVSSATYTLSLNGDTFGFFPGKRGLRIIDCSTEKLPFHFHPLCKPMRLTHLMFADDLLLFCKGDAQSIMVLLRAYESFSRASGLKMNPQKSCAYFNGVPPGLKKEILSVSGIKEGSLPFKYLGVPITAVKPDKLWVQWVHHVYLKGQSWQSYNPSSDTSWHWRKVCHVRDTIKEGFSDGIWSIGVGEYSVKSCYSWLRDKRPVVDWHRSVWNAVSPPKHCFIAWLISSQALMLKEKLFKFSQELYSYLAVKVGAKLDATNQLQSIMMKRWSRLRKQVTTAILLAAWYLIWNQRNEARLFYKVSRPDLIAEHIWRIIHTRIRVLSPQFISVKDKLWLSRVHLM